MTYGKRLKDSIKLQDALLLKAKIIQTFRCYLYSIGAIEIPMPILQKTREGAPVNQWETCNPLTGENWYIRHCMEDHLRRLTPTFPRVFEIGKVVRAETPTHSHAIEFNILELVFRELSYLEGIELVKKILESISKIKTSSKFYCFHKLDQIELRKWDDICHEQTGFTSIDTGFLDMCRHWVNDKSKLQIPNNSCEWEVLEHFMKYAIEPNCIRPTIITHFPKELEHVCSSIPGTNHVARFSIICEGVEITDGGSKFIGSTEYRRIYKRNALYRKTELGLHDNDLPEDFFNELDMWPFPVFTAGIGIDRIVSLLTNNKINDIIEFY